MQAGTDLYVIGSVEGFTEQIGQLVSMLRYVRHGTLATVKTLSFHDLDTINDQQGNSIGALLLHIAAAEVGYQAATFFNRELSEEEKREWGSCFALGERSRAEITGYDLPYYVEKLERVRAITLQELAVRDDRWLFEETTFGINRINNYFKWFHVVTHEVNHRGQIRSLIRQTNQKRAAK